MAQIAKDKLDKNAKGKLKPLQESIGKVLEEETFEKEWNEAIPSDQLKAELHLRIEKMFLIPPKGK